MAEAKEEEEEEEGEAPKSVREGPRGWKDTEKSSPDSSWITRVPLPSPLSVVEEGETGAEAQTKRLGKGRGGPRCLMHRVSRPATEEAA